MKFIIICNLVFVCLLINTVKPNGAPDNLGKEFLVVFMLNDGINPNLRSLELFLTTSHTIPVQVRITAPKHYNPPLDIRTSVVSGVVERIVIPPQLRMEWTAIEGKTILVQADNDIAVYGLNREQFSSDGFLSYPVDVIGYEYLTVSFAPSTPQTMFAIATKYDNTQISIKLPQRRNTLQIRVELYGQVFGSGDWMNFTLQAYESFQCVSLSSSDLTATRIISDKPIAVFSGNPRTSVGEAKSTDHLSVQLPPLQALGTQFPIVPMPGRTVGDFIRVVGNENMTTIKVVNNKMAYYEIGRNDYYVDIFIPSNENTLLVADKPVMVAQISQSQKSPTEQGDASMLLVTASAQYTSNYIFSTAYYNISNSNVSYINWLVVIIKAAYTDGLIFDGKPFSLLNPQWRSIPETDMVGTQIRIAEGPHTIKHISSAAVFSGYIYGTQDRESYSFQLGTALAPINQPCIPGRQLLFGDGLDNDCDNRIDEELCLGAGRGVDDDGDGKVDEDCSLKQEIVDGVPDSGGKQFLIMFMENSVESPLYLPLEVYVTPVIADRANVRVETPKWYEPSYRVDTVVTLGVVQRFTIPYTLKEKGTTLSSKALFITSDEDITVVGVNKELYSTDAFLAFPLDVLGNLYYIVTFWPNSVLSKCQFGIVGVNDGTKVEIVFPAKGNGIIEVEFAGARYTNGDTLVVVMNRYATLQIQSQGDLSGTLVRSSQKVAVFSGNIRTSVGDGTSRDHLVTMLPAVESWGKYYCTVPTPARTAGDYFYVVASENNSVVEIMNKENFTLNSGEVKQIMLSSTEYRAFKSSKPVLLLQISLSQKSIYEKGDASMFLLPAVEQWANAYTFSTNSETQNENPDNRSFLMLVCETAKISGLLLDGQYLPNLFTTWHTISGTKYSGTSFVIKDGVHRIQHDDPTVTFSAVVYGNTDRESYGFPAGMRIAPINAPCVRMYMVPGDGIDNDCDGQSDEDKCDGSQQQSDNSDCATIPNQSTTTVSSITTTGISSNMSTTTTPYVIIGPSGPQGLPGRQGFPGVQGLPGSSGYPGSDGLNGMPGKDGATGIKGAVGEAGLKGSPGLNGLNGTTGANGVTGVIGPTGFIGSTGQQGPRGETGIIVKGSPGDLGITGLSGITGASGQTGMDGLRGIKGDKGEKGVVGQAGAKGEVGDPGEQGSVYTDIDECLNKSHDCSQICINTIGSYACQCRPGYQLDSSSQSCNDNDECEVNNGGCSDRCINTVGSFICSCSMTGYILSKNGRTCIDVDECKMKSHNCSNNQLCVNLRGSYLCINNTYKQEEIEVIESCSTENGGCSDICSDSLHGVVCLCSNNGFRLGNDNKTCVDIDECSVETSVCLTPQLCINSIGSYACIQKRFRSESRVYTTTDKNAALQIVDLSGLVNGNLILGALAWLAINSAFLLLILLLLALQHCRHVTLLNHYNEDLGELHRAVQELSPQSPQHSSTRTAAVDSDHDSNSTMPTVDTLLDNMAL